LFAKYSFFSYFYTVKTVANISPEAHLEAFLQEIETLRKANFELNQAVADKDTLISGLTDKITLHEEKIISHEALIAKLQRMLFGQSRERFEAETPSIQLQLEFCGEMTAEEISGIEAILNKKKEAVKQKEASPKAVSKRMALPKHLSVEVTIIQPEGDLSQMKKIGQETSEYLDYSPAKHFIRQIVRPVYAPITKEGSFTVAAIPDSVFEKSLVTTATVAHLLYSKFVMHLPIDRLLKELHREKIEVKSNTIYNWVRMGIERLEILYEYKFNKLAQKKYLQVDETTLQVLESEKKGATHLGYFWVYNDPLTGSTLFKYEKGRGAEFPEEILKNFRGYLQTDGYAGYQQLGKSQDVVHVACWAHARRKFEEAIKTDKKTTEVAMALIQELYDVERQAREGQLTADQRKELRLEKSLPVYNLLGKFIASNLQKALPKSTIGKALKYSFDRWVELGIYINNGLLEIDNNLVENAIRPIAIGRKNWLFAGTHESAQRLAIMYTFMNDCKKNDVNPEQWLSQVLEKILSANIQELHMLLPENFGDMDGGV
jgi:transposase